MRAWRFWMSACRFRPDKRLEGGMSRYYVQGVGIAGFAHTKRAGGFSLHRVWTRK